MSASSPQQLEQKRCKPCEGGVEALPLPLVEELLTKVDGWELSVDGLRIRKIWNLPDFLQGMRFLNTIAELAEAEGHHPDLRLENYRTVTVSLWTRAVGGLSENDFILASKIDRIPLS